MEKKGLGRGLGALIPGGEKQEIKTESDIEVSRIKVSPYQPRESFNDEKFQELVNSVKVHGVLQPVVVRMSGEGEYELVAGERRLRAAIASGLQRIPAVVRELTNEQALQVALIENLQREDINPVEAAVAYQRLASEFGFSQEEIAFGLGKSRSAVANTMRILNLPGEVVGELRKGKISEGHARAILSVASEKNQLELCRKITSENLTVREAERISKGYGEDRRDTENEIVSRETISPELDPNILEIETRLREIFRTKAKIVKKKSSGRIEIEFYTDDDLDRILNILLGW